MISLIESLANTGFPRVSLARLFVRCGLRACRRMECHFDYMVRILLCSLAHPHDACIIPTAAIKYAAVFSYMVLVNNVIFILSCKFSTIVLTLNFQ